MDILRWMARCASRLRWPKASPPEPDDQHDRALAARSLRTRLPPHLRRDIGADDG
ncbi:MAG: hypothetical protein K9G83_09815 [Hyphomonadaceae bacterium]|jgi:hypothetical protein|nr:hypothetical protein [Hyphomonadaceae bacterium]